MECRLGVLQNASGSAEVKINGVRVVCGVSGPMEAKIRQELPRTSYLEVNVSPSIGVPTPREKVLESKVKSFMTSVVLGHLFPRQLIQVNLQILENENNLEKNNVSPNDLTSNTIKENLRELNACINAAFLAIVDANVSIGKSFNANFFTLKGGKAHRHDGGSSGGVSEEDSEHLVVYAIKDDKVDSLLLSESRGEFTEAELLDVLAQAESAAMDLHWQFADIIKRTISAKFVFTK